MAARPATSKVTVAAADPRAAECVALLDEMEEFTQRTYPEDAGLGIFPPTLEQLAEGVLMLAQVDGQAVGTGAIVDADPLDGAATMEVKRMYVRELARGRGVAEQVLGALQLAAQTRGARKLALLCGPRQPSALRLYERCGFVRRGAFGTYREDPLCIYFEKTI